MTQLTAPALLAARVLLSLIFILSGFQKITGYAGTVGYMEAMGVPGALLPLVILTELGGGLAILVGFQTRIAAILLAGFTVIAGYLFHYVAITGADPMADMMQQIMFMKNVTIAGGFLALFASGAGAWSLDARRGRELVTV
ncbi:DoxX family protein [Chthonobacter rhizosphaerae]|uniref:DoxX family protein n=1 Tax=Chthonobacter rhizosphaerae TaxID=2735553 RepID=UPI0015EE8B69|nr:DoxX family protein [Chthonobacter rhizosphaerae]